MVSNLDDDLDRDILDIIPERFDADADSRQARTGYRLRSIVMFAVAVVVVAGGVAGGLHFFGKKSGAGPDGVPIIRASDQPVKIPPADRGGADIPGRDMQVYNVGKGEGGTGSSSLESILPPPAVPDAVPPASGGMMALPPAVSMPPPAANNHAGGPPAITPPPAVTPPPPVIAAVPPPHPPAVAPPPANRPAVVAPPPPPPPVVTTAPPQPAVAPPSSPPKPQQPRTPVALSGGEWLIQLGAVRSAADADKEWNRIQRTNADLLGTLKLDVLKVDLGTKGTFWRLRGGPLSEASARQVCTDLKTRNQGCILVRK